MNKRIATDAAAAQDCGCAPTAAERESLWAKSITRRNAFGLGALSVVALAAFGVTSGVSAAHAASYPSWDDVQRAKNNEAAKAAEVTRIEGLIKSLTRKVAETEAAAKTASDEFFAAQQEYFAAITEAESLQAQADEQAKIADEAARKAGQVASQLYRNGGDDTALELFFSGSGDNADELLSRLGTMEKFLEYNKSIYDKAASSRNAAQSLSDQAQVAREERDRLQQIAEQKMEAAQQAAEAAKIALDEQAANLDTMKAQLAALKDTTTQTVAGYQAGVAAREAQEKARREREAAAAAANGGGNGGGGGSAKSGGWVRPMEGLAVQAMVQERRSAGLRAVRRATTTARTSPTDVGRRSMPLILGQSTMPAQMVATETTFASSMAGEWAPVTRISSPEGSSCGAVSGSTPGK